MNILVCGNYVNYYVWSSYILTQYSSPTMFLKLISFKNDARRFPSTYMLKIYASTIQCSVLINFIKKKKKKKKKKKRKKENMHKLESPKDV